MWCICFILLLYIYFFFQRLSLATGKKSNHIQTLICSYDIHASYCNTNHDCYQPVFLKKRLSTPQEQHFDFRASSRFSQHEHFWISSSNISPLLPLLYNTSLLQLPGPSFQRTCRESQESIPSRHCCCSKLLSMLPVLPPCGICMCLPSTAHTPPFPKGMVKSFTWSSAFRKPECIFYSLLSKKRDQIYNSNNGIVFLSLLQLYIMSYLSAWKPKHSSSKKKNPVCFWDWP